MITNSRLIKKIECVIANFKRSNVYPLVNN
jgi:hypothetical protein